MRWACGASANPSMPMPRASPESLVKEVGQSDSATLKPGRRHLALAESGILPFEERDRVRHLQAGLVGNAHS